MVDFDIAIIGGGIQGAGCAQAAAAAGYSVCLLEKGTWGEGTSSRSTKLIHGGLRYLETGQFGLVRKALKEREILLEIGGPLIYPAQFLIPVYESSRRRPWQISLGLSIYCLLGGMTPLSRYDKIPQREWLRLSGLRRQGLQEIFRYWDARTDDLKLTRAVIKSAGELGAELHEHCAFLGARPCDDRQGFTVSYGQEDHEKKLSCGALINAGGPWAGAVQKIIEGAPEAPPIELVQGAHIVLAGHLTEHCLYVESSDDHRPLFILPWHENTLIGSTETPFSGDPAECKPTAREVEYLLRAVRHYFPEHKAEVVDSFAGLRVLPYSRQNFNDRPRDTMIRYDNPDRPRQVSLYGGKLTTYRVTAEQVIKTLARTLGIRERKADTAKLPLHTKPTD